MFTPIDRGAASGGVSERWTVYDGDNPYADFNASGSLTTRYLYGPAIDYVLGRWAANGDVDWYLEDFVGSVRQIVDGDGTVEDNITYDSFGKILSESNPENGDRFKYTGREWDAVFEEYYYRARYYSPDIGRFTSLDPLGFKGGDANLYRYVSNNPTIFRDPWGTNSLLGNPAVAADLFAQIGMGGAVGAGVAAAASAAATVACIAVINARPGVPLPSLDDLLYLFIGTETIAVSMMTDGSQGGEEAAGGGNAGDVERAQEIQQSIDALRGQIQDALNQHLNPVEMALEVRLDVLLVQSRIGAVRIERLDVHHGHL